jgi:hypothetical protein
MEAFALVDFAAVGAQLAFHALAHDRALIRFLRSFFERTSVSETVSARS